MPDLLASLVADCPKTRSFSIYDRCKAVYEKRGEPPGEVVGVDEVAQVHSQLVVSFAEVAFDSCVLDRAVHSFDLPIIRYEIIGASLSGCFRKGTGDMVSPSGTRGAGSTKVREAVQRQWAESPSSLRGPPLATFPDAPRARISRCRVARQLPF
jgi:hypothetical protein